MWKVSHNYYNEERRHVELVAESIEELKASKEIGFLNFLERDVSKDAVDRVGFLRDNYDQLAVVGVGGSSLGSRAFLEALFTGGSESKVLFFDNSDPLGFEYQWQKIKDPAKIHWLIISKSGTTAEVLTITDTISDYLKSSDLELSKNATVITELKPNYLNQWAEQKQIPVFGIPEDLGGRYSFFSNVGYFPCAFYGFEWDQVKAGYEWALKHNECSELIATSSLQSFEEKKHISQLWFYRDRMERFGEWWCQLWAESLAKKTNKFGKRAVDVTTPMFCRGASSQHSVLQQLVEGSRDKHLIFVRVSQSETGGRGLMNPSLSHDFLPVNGGLGTLFQAQARGTIESLWDEEIPSIGLITSQLDPGSLSALYLIKMLAVACLGQCLGINAFNQPGVELSKAKTRQILKA